jgi:MFS family permease
MHLSPVFWWVVALATTLSLARFSQAFLLLKAHDVGIDAAFIPIVLVLMNLAFSVSAYPFGMLADRLNRRLQLLLGSVILIAADLVLAFEATAWAVAWSNLRDFRWAAQGLSASVADAAPSASAARRFDRRGRWGGDLLASFGAGMLWATRAWCAICRRRMRRIRGRVDPAISAIAMGQRAIADRELTIK